MAKEVNEKEMIEMFSKQFHVEVFFKSDERFYIVREAMLNGMMLVRSYGKLSEVFKFFESLA